MFITGINGFIGTRVAEAAVARGYRVSGIVRDWGRTARVARLPVRLMRGDVLDAESLQRAVAGADAVIHLAADYRARGADMEHSIAEGARNVAEAAVRCGVERLVHVSSLAVFGLTPQTPELLPGPVDVRAGNPYSDGKIRAEIAIRDVSTRSGLSLVTLRPAIVYGPWGSHDLLAIRLLREGRMALVDGAEGHFNGIYVDDLVEMLLASLTSVSPDRRIFHIAAGGHARWRDFILAHAHALYESEPALPTLDYAAALRAWEGAPAAPPAPGMLERIRFSRAAAAVFSVPGVHRSWVAFRRAIGKPKQPRVQHGDPPPSDVQDLKMSRHEAEMFNIFGDVRIGDDHARELLGGRTPLSFDEGMRKTAAWVRWAFHPDPVREASEVDPA